VAQGGLEWPRGPGVAQGGLEWPRGAWSGTEDSRNLRFPDFMTTAQEGGRLSALAPAAFTPRKYSWYSFLLEAESTPGP